MHDVAKFMGADQIGSQSVYGSLRVVSESVTNFEKSLIFSKDLPADKAMQTMQRQAQYSHGCNLLVGHKQVCLRCSLHNCNLNPV